jgi:hypothetical protein
MNTGIVLIKNISLGNYFYFILGKKTNSKHPMTKYYSLYIRHNFVLFFCPGYNKSNFLEKYNIQVQYLFIFEFKKSLIF